MRIRLAVAILILAAIVLEGCTKPPDTSTSPRDDSAKMMKKAGGDDAGG